MIVEERAYARAGLLGNPSDGYFGKTVSISIKNFGAHILLYESPELFIQPADSDVNSFRNVFAMIEEIDHNGYYGGDRLIKAAIKKFVQYCQKNKIPLVNRNFTVRYHSSIPRQVGLAGSSAIITATMRALIKFYGVKIEQKVLPTLVLNAEVEELGINAGLQDRVIQVYEGCVYMDFEKAYLQKHNYGKYVRVNPEKMTSNIYVAYKTDLSKVSGTVLNDIKVRYDRGDKEVIDTLAEIAGLADRGRVCIEEGNLDELNELIDHNFNLRKKIMHITDSNIELVETARKCGASAKFSGSGGAIIGLYKNNDMLTRLIVELKKINARVIKPFIK
ncbi:GHMP kinase [candidate division KSB1 bacterium]|nr:GHMP kinase [candidate division KSB1 bacterium]